VSASEGYKQHRSSGGFGKNPNEALRFSGGSGKGGNKLYKQQVEPLLSKGFDEQAEPILRLLAQCQSPIPEVFRDLGTIYEKRNEFAEAKLWYERWLALLPSQAHQRLAQAQKAEQLSLPDLALQRYLDALELRPTQPEALHRASALLLDAGRFKSAMPLLLSRLELEKNTAELLTQASWCFLELGCLDDAFCLANRAFSLQPNDPIALTVKAHQCQKNGRHKQALQHAEQALSVADGTPKWPTINRLLSRVFFDQGLLELSKSCLDVALMAEPLRVELHRLRGEILLLQNCLHEGFVEFRWCQPHSSSNTKLAIPGSHQSVALVADGTLGDTLMFSRYAPWLKECKNLTVRLFVQQPLVTLLRCSLKGSIAVLPVRDLNPSTIQDGVILPLLSAPAEYGTCQEFPELSVAHLQADQKLIDYWRQRLHLQPGERLVGVNWCGSPLNAITEYYKSDIPLEAFSSLEALPNTRLVSFQKGFGTKQLSTCSFRNKFIDNQQEITAETRIEHTAALMSLCDWIVSDDSGPAHLSGCMGVPNIVILPMVSNWRWGAGIHSPWYPNSLLLRRGINQDWKDLVDEASLLILDSFRP